MRLQQRPDLGPMQPAKPRFAAAEVERMVATAKQFVREHQARGCTKVFYVERLDGETYTRASRDELEAVSCERVRTGQLEPYM